MAKCLNSAQIATQSLCVAVSQFSGWIFSKSHFLDRHLHRKILLFTLDTSYTVCPAGLVAHHKHCQGAAHPSNKQNKNRAQEKWKQVR